MSTATVVPETRGLDGDDARVTLRRVRIGPLLGRAFVRFRVADGTSHARSLAFLVALGLVQAIIGVAGLAILLGGGGVSEVIARTLDATVPSYAGDTLQDVLGQAERARSSGQYAALVFGLLGALVTGTTAFGQVERAANRIYGVEKDRPTTQKYGVAFLLTITAGVATIISLVMLSSGQRIGEGIDSELLADTWKWVRWPLGLLALVAAVTAVFRWCPRRVQPDLSWMLVGGAVSTVSWVVVSVGMGRLMAVAGSLGEAYGPMAGVVLLLFWSFFSAVALLFGLAVAAQLEAERSGLEAPESEAKVHVSTRAA